MSEPADAEQIYLEAVEKWESDDFAGAGAVAIEGARLGDANCMNLLGGAYGVGLGVRKSFTQSMHWHRRALSTDAQVHFYSNIAVTYNRAGDQKQAAFWWRRALARGDISAALDLAKLLLQTRRPRDIVRAVALLQQVTSARVWQQISLADYEEAQEFLLRLRKSRRWLRSAAPPST